MPPELVDRVEAAGLFALWLPRSLGGLELDPATTVRIIEEISRWAFNTGVRHAWLSQVAAVVLDEHGVPRTDGGGDPEGRLAFFPTERGQALDRHGDVSPYRVRNANATLDCETARLPCYESEEGEGVYASVVDQRFCTARAVWGRPERGRAGAPDRRRPRR